MALHTYADTYAHCHFSGFHGYENEASIQRAFNKLTRTEAVPGVERTLLRELPSIGHANVGTVPDICSYDISYRMKSSETSGLDETVERDNTASFSACSRQILDLLCDINGVSCYGDGAWEELQTKLAGAQYVKKDIPQLLAESFGKAFPDISFTYDKNSRLSIKLRVERNANTCAGESGSQMEDIWIGEMREEANANPAEFWAVAMPQEANQDTLLDAFSPQGNSGRSVCVTFWRNQVKNFFNTMSWHTRE